MPKCPRASGYWLKSTPAASSLAFDTSHLADKCGHPLCILDALGGLDPAADIHPVRPALPNCLRHVAGMQPASQQERPLQVARSALPVEGLAAAAALPGGMAVKQKGGGIGIATGLSRRRFGTVCHTQRL